MNAFNLTGNSSPVVRENKRGGVDTRHARTLGSACLHAHSTLLEVYDTRDITMAADEYVHITCFLKKRYLENTTYQAAAPAACELKQTTTLCNGRVCACVF